jgi:hypothetical protein
MCSYDLQLIVSIKSTKRISVAAEEALEYLQMME